MELFGGLQYGLQLLFFYGVVLVELAVFADAALRPARYWQAADINRPAWLAILGLSPLLLFAFPGQLLGIFGLAGIVATIVYVVDRRPKLQQLKGGGGGRGPYGGW